ncbi:hypothetical protein EDD15DRAFT_2219738 [Pisolithus albus]|nr:hypothetical protein EDD15DRAFT_2219738 [Pisolithus albus]
MANAGFSHLRHVASSPSHPSVSLDTPVLSPLITTSHLHYELSPAERHQLLRWISSLSTRCLYQIFVGDDSHLLNDSLCASLLIPPSWRRFYAECLVRALFTPFPRPQIPPGLHASDGSLLPVDPRPLQPRALTFSSVTSSHTLTASLDYFNCSASILHAELYGLIASALAPSTAPSVTLLTDHHNILRTLGPDIHGPPNPHSWLSLPARYLYRWLLDITSPSSTQFQLQFTPAHTPVTSTDTYANDIADHLASTAQAYSRPPPVPVPTFAFDSFFLYTTHTGLIESASSPVILHLFTRSISSSPRFRPTTLLLPSLYEPLPPPPYRYTKASSAFSAVVQLYARSSQLDTAATRFERHHTSTPYCHFGCLSLETTHHLFVSCHHFQFLRDEYTHRVCQRTEALLCEAETTCCAREDCSHGARSSWPTERARLFDDTRRDLRRIAAGLFVDDASVWPQSLSHFYLGSVPAISTLLSARHFPRLVRKVANLWHEECILLAGRIWGEYKRAGSHRSTMPSHVSPSAFPYHLRYLLSS